MAVNQFYKSEKSAIFWKSHFFFEKGWFESLWCNWANRKTRNNLRFNIEHNWWGFFSIGLFMSLSIFFCIWSRKYFTIKWNRIAYIFLWIVRILRKQSKNSSRFLNRQLNRIWKHHSQTCLKMREPELLLLLFGRNNCNLSFAVIFFFGISEMICKIQKKTAIIWRSHTINQ